MCVKYPSGVSYQNIFYITSFLSNSVPHIFQHSICKPSGAVGIEIMVKMNTKENLGSRHLSIAVCYDLEAQPTTWYGPLAEADHHELPYFAL